MEGDAFPISHYLESLTLLLRSVNYEDNSYQRSERQSALQNTYVEAAQYFVQEFQQGNLKMSLRRFEPMLTSIAGYVVYCYPQVPADVKTDLTIYFTLTVVLDDDMNDISQPSMENFFEDLIQGKEQRHPWWKVINKSLLNVVKHYGSFCAFNMIRSTLDFFQGCWIEQYHFHGFAGSHDFPLYLRRLNSLGQCVAGSLFPARQYDEQALFPEIVSAIPSIDNAVIFVNDLMSFYKEFDDARDQVSLATNYCAVEGINLHQALEKLSHEAIRACKQLSAVFEDKDPQVKTAVNAWLRGYITWHLCDHRYRLEEVFERAGDSPDSLEFRRYYEQARSVGGIDKAEWAVPSFSDMLLQPKTNGCSL